MTPKTFFDRLKTLIRDIEKAPGELLFHDVKVVCSFDRSFLKRLRFPSALIVVSGFRSDVEHPEIGDQTFSIISFINNRYDIYGEKIFTGSGNTLGMHEVTRRVQSAIVNTQTLTDSISILEGDHGGIRFPTGNLNIMYREFSCHTLLEAF